MLKKYTCHRNRNLGPLCVWGGCLSVCLSVRSRVCVCVCVAMDCCCGVKNTGSETRFIHPQKLLLTLIIIYASFQSSFNLIRSYLIVYNESYPRKIINLRPVFIIDNSTQTQTHTPTHTRKAHIHVNTQNTHTHKHKRWKWQCKLNNKQNTHTKTHTHTHNRQRQT